MPYARELTELDIGRSGAPIVSRTRIPTGADLVEFELWSPGGTIHFTIDGSMPSETSTVYEGVFETPCDAVVKAINIDESLEASVVIESVPTVACCLADTNQDGRVNGIDFEAWLSAFNRGSPVADQNSDGQIDGLDCGAWLANFNAGCL